jgi:serine/threonine-protein kinase
MSDTGPKREVLVGALHEGDVLAERYRLGHLLGAGGMGVVVEAERLADGARVAIKLMQTGRPGARADKFAARMLREAKATATLRDEHVVRALDVGGLPDGTYYFVMELLEGADLLRVIKDHGPLSLADAIKCVLQASAGVAEAHAVGIVHRDLKPQNLFLAQRKDGPPIVKVLDFGISKVQEGDDSSLTTTGSSLGSPQYMSIEQFRNARTVDHRTDIWSMGMILHFLLTGRTAYEADTVATFLFKLTTSPPTPIRAQRSDVPEAIEQIVLRCLEKDRNRRFANLGELAHALLPFGEAELSPLVAQIDAYVARAPALRSSQEEATFDTGPDSLQEGTFGPVLTSTNTGVGMPTAPPAAPPRSRRFAVVMLGALLFAVVGGVLGARSLRVEPRAEASTVSPATAATAVTEAPQGATTAPAPDSAQPATVTIRLALSPANASVELDGQSAPLPLTLPKDGKTHRIVARAPGHQPETREIEAQSDAYLEITLKPLAPSAGAPRTPTPPVTAAPPAPAAPSASAPKGPRFKGPMEQTL